MSTSRFEVRLLFRTLLLPTLLRLEIILHKNNGAMCFKFTLNSRFHVSLSDFLREMHPNLNLPISCWPSLILCSFNCCIWATSCVSTACVFSSSQNNCSCQHSSESTLRGECAASPHLPLSSPPFLFSTLSEHVLDQIKGRNNFIGLIFFFFFWFSIIILVKSKFVPYAALLPSLTLYSSILFLSSLSRSCKLQIRNIPPHMQWEVSANRLLTASRVAHYQDSQPGSCSGVWSHLPLPSFGFFLLWGAC